MSDWRRLQLLHFITKSSSGRLSLSHQSLVTQSLNSLGLLLQGGRCPLETESQDILWGHFPKDSHWPVQSPG